MTTLNTILLCAAAAFGGGLITAILLDCWAHGVPNDDVPDYSDGVPPHRPGEWL